jgi:biopolymer transport protein ExbB
MFQHDRLLRSLKCLFPASLCAALLLSPVGPAGGQGQPPAKDAAISKQAMAPADAGASKEPEVPSSQPRETVLSLTLKGGWLMIPIGLCSVIVLTWAIERAISLRRSRISSPGLLEGIFRILPSRARVLRENIAVALDLCDSSGTFVGRILRTGVEKIHRDEAHAQSFLEEAVAKEVHLLRRHLRPFEICVAVAPLLGLLGTIFGMITCFERSTFADSAARAETLANGIYLALVTTAAGLTVAIPALVIHHYFLGKVDRTQDVMEEAATEFLDHYYGTTVTARPRPAGSPILHEKNGVHEKEGLHEREETRVASSHLEGMPSATGEPPGGAGSLGNGA